MKIINKTKNVVIAAEGRWADDAVSRLIGLINRSSISPSEALVITDCRSIHMFFMQFPIDVFFVDRANKVIGLVREIGPYRMSPYFFRATKAIEAYPGVIEKTKTALGDEIIFEE